MLITKVAIYDKDFLSRETFKILLKKIPFIEIVGEYYNVDDLIDKIKIKSPQIVFYDLQTNELNDITGIKKILISNPDVKIIITSNYEDFRTIVLVFGIGAYGFIIKRELSVNNLTKAIYHSNNNHHYLSPRCEYKMDDINKMLGFS